MITATAGYRQPAHWQRLLARSITHPADLLQRLQLPFELLPAAQAAADLFPLRVPLPYLERMHRGDPGDPLLRQVLPLGAECDETPGFNRDPVGDLDAMLAPGLLQKYRGRALVISTGACAIHCRYCFRRHFPYGSGNTGRGAWTETLEAIRRDPGINEVILSGGDPLSLSDTRLAEWVTQLQSIPQLKRLRLHTRTPVVVPQRVDDALCDWLSTTSLRVIVVLHVNHAQELDAAVAAATARLTRAGATLLNQSVLLKGVNDDVAVLAELSEALFEVGVLPYYLHLLDKVDGAAHYQVEHGTACDLHRRLSALLPGYLLPRLVVEAAGAASKLPVRLPDRD